MKTSVKRIFSGLLSLCLLVFPSAAFDGNTASNMYSVTELREIEAEREHLYDVILEQLEAQDAVEYFDRFRFLADNQIQIKYYSTNARATSTVLAPYGGWVCGSNSDIEMYVSYLDADKTMKLYKNRNATLTENLLGSLVWGILERMLGFGHLGDIAGISNSISGALVWDEIMSGTGCAELYRTYDKHDSKDVYVMWEWTNTPYMTLLSSSNFSNIDYGLYGKGA